MRLAVQSFTLAFMYRVFFAGGDGQVELGGY
jgi:hypothetical protein